MEQKKRFSGKMFVLFFCVALITDIINIIPYLGTLIALAYWAIFTWFLYKTKHGLLNWKLLASEGISIAIEIFPFLQVLPSITAATILIFIISRFEDKTGLKISNATQIKNLRSPKKPQPLNQNGVRMPMQDDIIKPDFSTPDEDNRMAA